ncbi:MAG: hypothetical protein KatS3mg105_4878 [Gemmatales bacterium]|nr:MAG: hypothetical protein KatS3mg105_4878 [Gemmatales bacterium]
MTMTSAVFTLEMLRSSRRGRQHLFRWIYAGWLLVQFVVYFFIDAITPSISPTPPFMADYLAMFVTQQMILIAAVTPAFVAGAITDEKTRGTLQYLIASDVSSAEIIFGKLFGRLFQVAILFLAGLPVLCFAGVFGGLNLLLLVALLYVSGLAMLVVASASLLASVLCRQTRDAVLGLYSVGFLGLALVVALDELLPAASPIAAALRWLMDHASPLFLLEPAWAMTDVAELGRRLFRATIFWGVVSAVCLSLASWGLKPVYLRQLENAGRKNKRSWWQARRAPIGDDPIRWKEREIEGIAPLAALRAYPRWLGIEVVAAATIVSCVSILYQHLPPGITDFHIVGYIAKGDWQALVSVASHLQPADDAFRTKAFLAMMIFSLIVGIRCSGAVSGEREKQTWEALLLTPLETKQLIRGKLWGIIGSANPYFFAYAIPACLFSLVAGWLSFFWVVLGLAVTWLAMYYVGATGIWCSVRSKSSWRSLLGTLGFCYVGGFIVYGPVIFFMMIVISIAGAIFCVILDQLNPGWGTYFRQQFGSAGSMLFLAMCFGLAAAFWVFSFLFVRFAENRVSHIERTRHWKSDPLPVRKRRRTIRNQRNVPS